VAHHAAAAAAALECLSTDGGLEAKLLDHYHAALCADLVEFGAAADAADAASRLLTRDELQAQYEAALLDMCRLVFAYQWSRAKFGEPKPSLNKNAYNKHLANAVWLAARCDRLLARRGE
jgi:hypothetical protein